MRMRRILLSLAVLATGIVAVRLLVPGDPPGTGEPVAGAAAPGQVSAPAGDRLQASAPTPAARREAPDPGRPELEAASGRTDESSPPRSYPRAPEPARRSAPPPPPDGDPEQLAAWFERQVGGEILRQKHQDSVPPGREVDWAYLEDVFAGRISGIPDERQAGLSLPEIDELGQIPYVEQLRQEQRFQELEELGFENETVPWPVCLRTASCRQDAKSSPPGGTI